MKKLIFILPLLAFFMSSCLGSTGEDVDYQEWRKKNDAYLAAKEKETTPDGKKVFEKISPSWAPGDYVLMKWHNDRELTKNNLSPLSNSTVNVKYILEDVDGNLIQNSFSQTDSTYQSRPNNNVVGFWIALMNMHEGDSVTMLIPSTSAYGAYLQGDIKPFSTLVYHVKMQKVVDLLRP